MDKEEETKQNIHLKGWKRLGIADRNIWSCHDIVALNKSELLMVSSNKRDVEPSGICIYNIHSKKLIQIAKYPDECIIEKGNNMYHRFILQRASYDKTRDKMLIYFRKLEVYTQNAHKLIMFDFASKSFNRYDMILPQKRILNILAINNQIHLWCKAGQHYIYDEKTAKCVNKGYVVQTNKTFAVYDCHAVYVGTQNRILLMITYWNTNYTHVISNTFSIFNYCLDSEKWNKIMDISQFEQCFDKMILTENENYVILVPGDDEGFNDIGIIDISDTDEYTVSKSNVVAPDLDLEWISQFFVMPGGEEDKVIVYGFVRWICMGYKVDMIHDDVMSVIISYFSREMLHCVKLVEEEDEEDIDDEHWMIPLSSVLTCNQ